MADVAKRPTNTPAAKKAPSKKAAAKAPAKKAPGKKAAAKKAAAKKAAAKKAAAKKAPAKRAPAKKAPAKKAAARKAPAKKAPAKKATPRTPQRELTPAPTDPATILGLSQPVTFATVKRAWREYAARHHPDQGGDPATFVRGRTAYETLRDALIRSDRG